MKNRGPIPITKVFVCLILALAAGAAMLCAPPATAQLSKHAQAKVLYAKAQKLRQALDAEPSDSRTLAGYKKVVAAYRRVYLLTPSAPETTMSLDAVAQLYHDMADNFDQVYYQSSLVTYKFLLSQYPASPYRSEALFEIGKIEADNLQERTEAKNAFTEYLRRFPRAANADDARAELKELAEARDNGTAKTAVDANASPSLQQKQSATPDETEEAADAPENSGAKPGEIPSVTAIRTWNADDYTRVVVDLNGDVKYDSARINHPDRIYFDLYKARLGHLLTDKNLTVPNGFLKSVRVAQNKAGVVRLVLNVQSVKGYSAFMLPDPYRLVIDVHGAVSSANAKKPLPAIGAGKLAGDQSPAVPVPAASEKVEVASNRREHAAGRANVARPDSRRSNRAERTPPAAPSVAALPMRNGDRSLTRALGLKIRRIVIDPGHGGHDTGTIGPDGVMEKTICLDVALDLGRLIHQRLPGAKVIYTRKTDVFVPLEERTAIANQAKADLFISIHANSSPDKAARGVETYYLNFTTSPEALETASRENALSDASIHQLQSLIKTIARNDKIEESRELAIDIQNALSSRLRQVSTAERNRGVKKAPFVVLIGANMPSVLCEISFLSNRTDERMLEMFAQRERIAHGIFRGIETYLSSLNSLNYDRRKPTLVTERQAALTSSSRAQR